MTVGDGRRFRDAVRRCLTAALPLLLHNQMLGAQASSGIAAVDSAAAARGAWARGNAALRSGDTANARLEISRAANAWPRQPAYVWGLAVLSARTGDTVALRSMLTAYADLELGRDIREDTLFTRYLALPGFDHLATRLADNLRPMGRSRTVLSVPDSTLWPEGVDYDATTGRYYLTSIAHRTVLEIAPGGQPREVITRNSPAVGSLLAARVDAARGVLWATTSGMPGMVGYTDADSSIAALLRISLRDGTVQRRWDLPVRSGGHVLGDLSIGPAGDIFFTDSNEPVLYRLRRGADTLDSFRSPLFRSLQGTAPTPDGAAVYVADYSHGILRVDPHTGSVTRLDDPALGTSLGIDGIALHGNAIVAVQNGVGVPRIVRLRLDGPGQRIAAVENLDRGGEIVEPTTGVIVGDEFVYVANSLWNHVGRDGRLAPGARLTPPRLAAVRLTN